MSVKVFVRAFSDSGRPTRDAPCPSCGEGEIHWGQDIWQCGNCGFASGGELDLSGVQPAIGYVFMSEKPPTPVDVRLDELSSIVWELKNDTVLALQEVREALKDLGYSMGDD